MIAERIKFSVEEASKKLTKMAKKGLVWADEGAGKLSFRLAPFIIGICEDQQGKMDHELARLYEEYMADGGAVGIISLQPALHRVIPAQSAVESEMLLPYDDLKVILQKAKQIRVRDYICRSQQAEIEKRECTFPLRTCITLSSNGDPLRLEDIEDELSEEEAVSILQNCEEIGMVHTVTNVKVGIDYICNCCGCCCEVLRPMNEHDIEKSVASANYYALVDPNECVGCGTYIERCQVNAIYKREEISVVDHQRCIGCGVCVIGCPNGAAKLQLKPSSRQIDPPDDYKSWEQERLHNRGLIR